MYCCSLLWLLEFSDDSHKLQCLLNRALVCVRLTENRHPAHVQYQLLPCKGTATAPVWLTSVEWCFSSSRRSKTKLHSGCLRVRFCITSKLSQVEVGSKNAVYTKACHHYFLWETQLDYHVKSDWRGDTWQMSDARLTFSQGINTAKIADKY